MRFLLATCAALWATAIAAPTTSPSPLRRDSPSRSYRTVPGFFLQDDDSTDPSTFDPIKNNFGLKNQANVPSGTTQWQAFASKVAALNKAANASTSYKVLFMGRHGEGIHNVAQTYYGDFKWFLYWCEKNGNDTVTWFDAHLTDNGVKQAKALGQAWAHQTSVEKTPFPQSYYTSPLYRTCSTAKLTFGDLQIPKGETPFVPTIKEKLREMLGVATCNERSNKTFIHSQFPTYKFESGFSEKDELWSPYQLELPFSIDTRMRQLLDDVFDSDKNTWISFTSHSVSIASLLRVLGHRSFDLNTAGMLPVLVESVKS